MAAPKFLRNVSGKIKEIIAAVISTPDSIVATDSTGKIDPSFLPTGVGAEIILATASESIAAGAFVNVYSNAGVISVRNADATTNGKPAHGFVLAAFTTGNTVSVYLPSQTNTQQTGLTLGAEYYLAITPGAITVTAPSATGNIVQRIGIADKTTEIVFVPYTTIEIA